MENGGGTVEPRRPGRLAGRVCLVTGSTGIAAASAVRFADEGASIFVTSRQEDHCGALVAAVEERGGEAASLAADLTGDDAADHVVAAAVERFGRLDAVFNVAGGSGRRFGDGRVHEATPEAWDATLDMNSRSVFLVCRAAVRQLLTQEPGEHGERGSILNMASLLALHPWSRFFATHAYAASKGAVISLSLAMAGAYARQGIRVNVLAPSLVRTPMAVRAANDEELMGFVRRRQVLAGGAIEPEDVANAAVYFLSDESRVVTGQVLRIDGGWSVVDTSDAEAEAEA